MYLHIGGKKTILVKDIIAILDQESMCSSKALRNYLQRLKSENKLFGRADKAVSYLFVCDEEGREKVYCSSISSSTLAKRSKR